MKTRSALRRCRAPQPAPFRHLAAVALFRGSLCGLLCGLLPVSAAHSAPPLAAEIHPISQSLWLQVSPQGQRLFDEDLLSVIEGSGIAVRQRKFPKIRYEAEHSLTLDTLIGALPDEPPKAQVSAITRLRDEIKKWLLGFQLNDPRPSIEITDLAYAAEFQRISLRILGRSLSGDGIRARLDVVVPAIRITAACVSGRDLSNDWLGEFGIQDLHAGLGGGGMPLMLSSDFEIHLTDEGFSFVVGMLQTNLSQMPLELELSPEIRLPKVEVVINGRTLQLNPAPITELLKEQKESLTGALQNYLETMIREKAPDWFTQATQTLSMRTLEAALPVPALGAPQTMPVALRSFQLGFYPERLALTDDGSLQISGASFVEDRFAGTDAGILPPPAVTSSPSFDRDGHHDFALAIHPSVVNRLLSLSQNRRYFRDIKLDDGSSIELYESPRFEVGPDVPAGMMKMKLALKTASGGGLKRLFVSKDVMLKFDAFVRVIRNPDASFSLAMKSVDLDSLEVDASSATIGLFKGLVRNKVLGELKLFDAEIRQKPLMLAAQVRPPESLMGLRWKLSAMTTEPRSGYITAYFSFER